MAVLFAGLSLAPAARAQGTAAAESLYREGQRLMEAGKVHDACIKFAESQKLDPATGTLINLANCHEREGKTASAWAEFSQAATEAGRAGQKDREKFARDHSDALEKKLRTLVLSVSQAPANAEVKVDGQSFGSVGLGSPVPIDPGEHEILVTAPKKKGWTKKVTLEPGPGTTRVDVPALEDAPGEASASAPVSAPQPEPSNPAAPSEAPQESHTKRTVGFILGGVGIAALGTGFYFLLHAKSLSDQSNDEAVIGNDPTQDPKTRQDKQNQAVSDHDSAATSQTVGFIIGGAGLVAAGIGVYLIVSDKGKEHSSSARITPIISPHMAGASASFAF